MIRLAVRDLQHRRRRFAVALVGASLVFALSLVVQGLAASFGQETSDTIALLGVDRWMVSARSTGPFTGFAPLAAEQLAEATELGSSPVLVTREPLGRGTARRDAIVVGVPVGAPGSPRTTTRGRGVDADGEAVVSEAAGIPVGGRVDIGGTRLRVVGTVSATLLAGTHLVITTLEDAQRMVGAGPIVTALAAPDHPGAAPDGLVAMSTAQVRSATLEPLQDAIGTIEMMRTFLWIVASVIVGAILSLNAMERARDLAVLKAIGVQPRTIAGSVLVQAAALGATSAVVAAVVATGMAPFFPMRVVIRPADLLLLPVLAVAVSCLASIAAIRRVLAVSPATAFGAA